MYSKPSLHITKAAYEGRFIFVQQILREIFVICVPADQPVEEQRSIWVLELDELLYITNATEIKLPYFTSIIIQKVYAQTSQPPDFIISGTIVSPGSGNVKKFTDFKIKNYVNIELKESTCKAFTNVFGISLEDVHIASLSRKGNTAHIVGYRKPYNDEVYIQYNCLTKTIIQEFALFSDLGYINLVEVFCNQADEVFIVGYVETGGSEAAYFNKFLSVGAGAIPDQ